MLIRKFSIGMALFTSGKQADSLFELSLLSESAWFCKRLFKVFRRSQMPVLFVVTKKSHLPKSTNILIFFLSVLKTSRLFWFLFVWFMNEFGWLDFQFQSALICCWCHPTEMDEFVFGEIVFGGFYEKSLWATLLGNESTSLWKDKISYMY